MCPCNIQFVRGREYKDWYINIKVVSQIYIFQSIHVYLHVHIYRYTEANGQQENKDSNDNLEYAVSEH